MKKFGWFLGVAILALLASCSPKPLVYKDFHNFSIQKLGFDKSAIKMELEYYNPNNFGLQLKESDLDIYINGNLLGHSVTDTLVNIPRQSSFFLPVKFDVEMKNLIKNATNTIFGKEILIRLSGKVKAGKGNVFMLIPVEYETTQKVSLW